MQNLHLSVDFLRKMEENQDLVSMNIPDEYIWDEGSEEIVQNIGYESQGRKIMHQAEARISSRWFTVFTWATLILAPLSGIVSSVELATKNSDDPIIYPLLSAIASFAAAVAAGALKAGKYEEVTNRHITAANKFASIEENARRQLQKIPSHRADATKYVNWLSGIYEYLFSSAPLISSTTQNTYEVEAKKYGIVTHNFREISVRKEQKKISQETANAATGVSTPHIPDLEGGKNDMGMFSGAIEFELGRMNK